MSRHYEAVYIFDSALEDAAITDKLTRFHGLLATTDQVAVDHWGRRQLAYSIGPRENG
jgi:small subunit ribosomal protein S6